MVEPPLQTPLPTVGGSQSFTLRAIGTLSTRVVEVTRESIHPIAATPNPDLIADFAAQWPVAMIGDRSSTCPPTSSSRACWSGVAAGAPLLDVGIGLEPLPPRYRWAARRR